MDSKGRSSHQRSHYSEKTKVFDSIHKILVRKVLELFQMFESKILKVMFGHKKGEVVEQI